MRLRSKAREVALHILYQREITGTNHHDSFSRYLEYNPQKQEVLDFAATLLNGVIEHLCVIDSLIKKYAKNWGINRMAVIDRNILRIACFELIFLEDVPPKVAINEAIELAKRFGDIDSPRFINGVVDKIYKMEREGKISDEKM